MTQRTLILGICPRCKGSASSLYELAPKRLVCLHCIEFTADKDVETRYDYEWTFVRMEQDGSSCVVEFAKSVRPFSIPPIGFSVVKEKDKGDCYFLGAVMSVVLILANILVLGATRSLFALPSFVGLSIGLFILSGLCKRSEDRMHLERIEYHRYLRMIE